mgnify:CR=1 FL=1
MSKHRCPECGYVYDEERGYEYEGYAPGTKFTDLPADFVCPDCSVRYKEDFIANGNCTT